MELDWRLFGSAVELQLDLGSGSSDLDAGVAWIEAYGAPGAPQLIPHWEGGWALYSQYTVNSQSGD